jgi:class 3 adenylate cyclase/hemoglobin-like flavoprotein
MTAPPARLPRVTYFDADMVVEVEGPWETILVLSQRHRIPHMSECGGHARCTTCRVRCLDGLANLSPRTDVEGAIAEARGWDPFTRLACQTRVHGDVIVERLIRSPADATRMRVEESGLQRGREVSLVTLFCDLRGFTPLTERSLPYDVVHLLNCYFEAVGEPILNNNGYIDMYVGDAVVAHYGLDGAPPGRSCLDAVRSALLMQRSLEDLNNDVLAEFGVPLRIGIGVDLGTAIVGPIGHSSKRQLTAIGDSVNRASRIESATKTFGAGLLVPDEVMEHVSASVVSPSSFDAELKGTSGVTRLHEVTGFSIPDAALTIQSTFALVAQERKRFSERFYAHLFAMAPETEAQFVDTPPELQDRMFVDILFLVARSLSRLDELAPALTALGARHVAYGTFEAQLPIARRALIATLRELLGDALTAEAEAAWSQTYDAMAASMGRGMQLERQQPR